MQKLVFLFLYLPPYFIRAQETVVVSGKVTDQKNETVSIGDVLLFERDNDMLFKYTTLVEGRFSLEAIPKGSYRLRISCLGFEAVEQVAELDTSPSLVPFIVTYLTEIDNLGNSIYMNMSITFIQTKLNDHETYIHSNIHFAV